MIPRKGICLALVVLMIGMFVGGAAATETPLFAINWGASGVSSSANQTNLVSIYSEHLAHWKVGMTVAEGSGCYYGGVRYTALQSHTAGSSTEPGVGADWATYWEAAPTLCYYRVASWNALTSGSATVTRLLNTPAGKRAIILQGFDIQMFKHPDDRCQNSSGSLAGLSKSPEGDGFTSTTGNDGLPSGYTSPWHTAFEADSQQYAESIVSTLASLGVTIDYVLFDTEVGLNEWTLAAGSEAAILQDPRWAAYKLKLDALVQARTGNPSAEFPVNGSLFGSGSTWVDWDAQMYLEMSTALNKVFAKFQEQWPDVKCSDYGWPGWKVNDGVFDLNGHSYYYEGIVGTHASWDSYGWFDQASLLMGGTNAWKALIFSQNQTRGSVRAGYSIQPWIAYSGFEENTAQWKPDFTVGYPYTPSAYWKENIRHLALQKADPFLYFAPQYTSPVVSVNLSQNSVTVVSDMRGASRFRIIDSAQNNGNYTPASSSYSDALARTTYVANEPFVANGSDGTFESGSGAAMDAQLDTLLDELNGYIGTASPREVLTTSSIGFTSTTMITGLRYGNQALYRITVSRYPDYLDTSKWNSVVVNLTKNGTVFDSVVVPAGELGVYYNTAYTTDVINVEQINDTYYDRIDVTGTLSPDATGEYAYTGEYAGKPYYKRVSDSLWSIWWRTSDSTWIISPAEGNYTTTTFISPVYSPVVASYGNHTNQYATGTAYTAFVTTSTVVSEPVEPTPTPTNTPVPGATNTPVPTVSPTVTPTATSTPVPNTTRKKRGRVWYYLIIGNDSGTTQ